MNNSGFGTASETGSFFRKNKTKLGGKHVSVVGYPKKLYCTMLTRKLLQILQFVFECQCNFQ